MKDMLKKLVQQTAHYTELRYHKRTTNTLVVQKGRVDVANHGVKSGVGVRVLIDKAWGFAATSDISEKGIKKAIETAQQNASFLSKEKAGKPILLALGEHFRNEYIGPGFEELTTMPLEDKLGQIIANENQLASASPMIQLAKCSYTEIIEEKIIATSDGAEASLKIAQPEISLAGIADNKGEQMVSHTTAGVNGGWSCLFNHPSLDHMVDNTAQLAIDLLKAKYPEGGKKEVILAPSMVGLLCHEAIGHTVEADFVKAGSVAQGKIGTKVGSDLVNLNDTGCETISGYAVGNMPFDDEGIKTETTKIIENGVLTSYLHNRETAKEFGVKPTGNSRAWLFNDEPLIRMRNTYMEPGNDKLDDMIANVEDGYLVGGSAGGQADANGEFMFGCSYLWKIKQGKKTELLREATLSGIAFDVLKSIDAVSQEFQWDLGSGYCGKGQPAKVDAGGPYVKCKINVGGRV